MSGNPTKENVGETFTATVVAVHRSSITQKRKQSFPSPQFCNVSNAKYSSTAQRQNGKSKMYFVVFLTSAPLLPEV